MKRAIGFVVGQVPTALVLLTLGVVAVWGHRTGWKAPQFSNLWGSPVETAEKEDWCGEHNVPESRCITCNPQLAGADPNDWCREHGVAESKCTICHPELLTTGVAADWCAEHGVPESGCTICHPDIARRAASALPASGANVVLASAHSDAHGDDCCPAPQAKKPTTSPAPADACCPAPKAGATPIHEDDGHGRDNGANDTCTVAGTGAAKASTDSHAGHAHGPAKPDPTTCQTHTRKVQFASPDAIAKAGIAVEPVAARPMVETLVVNAEIQYDQTRVAQVSPRVAGAAWRVEAAVGSPVRKGQLLALVDAAEVGKAKAEYLQARVQVQSKSKLLERTRKLVSQDVGSRARLDEAEAALDEANVGLFNARQTLVNLGLPVAEADAADSPHEVIRLLGIPQAVRDTLDASATTANLVPVVAPFDGLVTERRVVIGEAVEPARPMFVIADTSHMWIVAQVPQTQFARVTRGQSVTFVPDGGVTERVTGTINWISTEASDQTRTVQIRAEVDNPDGRLLANIFGRATIELRGNASAAAVPSSAIHWEGCCNVAFVRASEDVFIPRKVRPGATGSGWTEVTVGLLPGELVATAGSHVLKSELLKGKLGDTCGGHD